MKIISIVGARPQFIKVAALHRAMAQHETLRHMILHTAQHYDENMSAIFFTELSIPEPDFRLDINEHSLASSTARMVPAISNVLANEKPDMVVVYGDTNSTLAGAISSKNLHLQLAHVEAGLRSNNDAMPEEYNRIQTDGMSDLLFCPTTAAMNNLLKEGFQQTRARMVLCGDIMLDAINFYRQQLQRTGTNRTAPATKFVLCTLHRQALVQSPEKLREVVSALNEINSEIRVTMPAHPRFKRVVDELGLQIDFTITEPVGYLEMISLLENCAVVITDSGGLQKEAFFCKKPCVTVRNETEWTELISAGVNFIGGDSSASQIKDAFNKALHSKGSFEHNFYGDGNSAATIVDELVRYLTAKK